MDEEIINTVRDSIGITDYNQSLGVAIQFTKTQQ